MSLVAVVTEPEAVIYEGQNWVQLMIDFPTEEEAAEFEAAQPKTLRLDRVYRRVNLSVNIRVNAKSGTRNEAGMKRLNRAFKMLDKHNLTPRMREGSANHTVAAFRAHYSV